MAAERAKRVLSSTLTTSIEIESLHTGIDYHRNVSRLEFEECCKDLFRYITEVLDNLLGKFDRSLIDDILLVGGSTRIPKIQATVSQYFGGRELNKSINPDEAVRLSMSVYVSFGRFLYYEAASYAAVLHSVTMVLWLQYYDIMQLNLVDVEQV